MLVKGRRIPCFGRQATIHNIDQITLETENSRVFLLELRGGPLAPGASESGSGAEIEVIVPPPPGATGPTLARLSVWMGRRKNKVLQARVGDSEVLNLNPREERRQDADVRIEAVALDRNEVVLNLGHGQDLIDARGGLLGGPSALMGSYRPGRGNDRVFGSPLSPYISTWDEGGDDLVVAPGGRGYLRGRTGDDSIFGGTGEDRIYPGHGRDEVSARAGNDTVLAQDGEIDVINCGPGDDTAFLDFDDQAGGCEIVEATPPPPPG